MAGVNYEFIIKSREDVTTAFVRGFMVGRGIRDGIYLSHEHKVHESYLRELLRYNRNAVHVITQARYRATLESALKRAHDSGCSLELIETRKLRRSSFEFKFEVFNKSIGTKIRRLMNNPGAGVRLVDYEDEIIVDPKAKGVEVYSPVHDYEFKGHGRVEGEFSRVMATRERFDRIENINCEFIQLHH